MKYWSRCHNIAGSIYDIYDNLSQENVKIGDDPELKELYSKASLHLEAAKDYRRKGMKDNFEYELEAVDETLKQLSHAAGQDKPEI